MTWILEIKKNIIWDHVGVVEDKDINFEPNGDFSFYCADYQKIEGEHEYPLKLWGFTDDVTTESYILTKWTIKHNDRLICALDPTNTLTHTAEKY